MARVTTRAPYNVRCSYSAKQLVSEAIAWEKILCLEHVLKVDNVGAERMSSGILLQATGQATVTEYVTVTTCTDRGGLAHRESGKFPGGPLPNYKILKLQISANSFDTKRVTWQCKCKPCFRCYLIPPVGSNKAPTLAALVADYRKLPERCSWSPR